MLAARLGLLWAELRMAVSIVYHALVAVRLAVLRLLGRPEEANVFVKRSGMC